MHGSSCRTLSCSVTQSAVSQPLSWCPLLPQTPKNMFVFLLYFCLSDLIGKHKAPSSLYSDNFRRRLSKADIDQDHPQPLPVHCPHQASASRGGGAAQPSCSPSSGPHTLAPSPSLSASRVRGHLCAPTRQSGGRGRDARQGSRSGPSTPPPAFVRASGTEAAGPRRTSSATRTNVV